MGMADRLYLREVDELSIRDQLPAGYEGNTFPQELWIEINGEPVRDIFKSLDVAIPGSVARLPSRHLLDSPDPGLALDGRVALLVCSECGDIGCGALFVRITLEEDRVVWSDFLYANDYDPESEEPKEGRYVFDRLAYEGELAPNKT